MQVSYFLSIHFSTCDIGFVCLFVVSLPSQFLSHESLTSHVYNIELKNEVMFMYACACICMPTCIYLIAIR